MTGRRPWSRALATVLAGLAVAVPSAASAARPLQAGGGREAVGPLRLRLASFCNVLTLVAVPLGPVFAVID
jgi:hypothetical protein